MPATGIIPQDWACVTLRGCQSAWGPIFLLLVGSNFGSDAISMMFIATQVAPINLA